MNRWLSGNGLGGMRMQTTAGAYFALMARLLIPRAQGLSEQEINAAMVGSVELSPAGKAVASQLAAIEPSVGVCARFKDPANWLGSITARAVGRLLEQLEVGTLASKPHSAEMTDMLKAQQAGARRIPLYLDTQYIIGHKTGDGPPCVANDVGIVYLKSGATVMVFLTDQIRGNYGEAELRIGEIARTVAEYFDGK